MSTTRRIYIAGPMRGRREFNFPAFDRAADRLEAQGWWVFNPAERDRKAGFSEVGLTGNEPLHELSNFSHREAMADDTSFICMFADAIYMLDGWQSSKGAVAERALALALGLDILYESDEDRAVLSDHDAEVLEGFPLMPETKMKVGSLSSPTMEARRDLPA